MQPSVLTSTPSTKMKMDLYDSEHVKFRLDSKHKHCEHDITNSEVEQRLNESSPWFFYEKVWY